MPRFEKGSPEAIEWGKRMRERKGNAKISRPAVEKGKPQPAKISGGSGNGGAGRRRREDRTPSPPTTPPRPPQRQRTTPPPPPRQRRPPTPPQPPQQLPVLFLPPPPPPQSPTGVDEFEEEEEETTGGRIPPPPSRVYGGKIPPPPSRSYDTSFEDKIDGVMLKGGALNDCPTCCGMGIVKIKGKGAKSSRIAPSESQEKEYDYLKYKNDPVRFNRRTNKLLRDNDLVMSYIHKYTYGKKNEITPEEIRAYNKS